MKKICLFTPMIAAFGLVAGSLISTSCTVYQATSRGEDDYDDAIERKAREKQMQETQQARSDSAQARSL